MAFKDINSLERGNGELTDNSEILKLQITGDVVEIPSDSFIRDADITRDNVDLILKNSNKTIIIEDYFTGFESPVLTAPSGASLSPQLVNSFIAGGNQFANTATYNDESPVGAVQEISGDATITRLDGTKEKLAINSPIYQGDVIETDSGSAINITFIDDSSFAVSEETRLAIDEYVFDPETQGGTQNFSVLKGVFVYTSGLIGREDPDDVAIETPVGSIGIRGTIIAGDVNEGEITVVEGAIVLRTPDGQEMTLANQFETAKLLSNNRGIQNLGQKSANEVIEKFAVVSKVAPNLFSSVNDSAAENRQPPEPVSEPESELETKSLDQPLDDSDMRGEKPAFDADGSTDQDGDSEVDGTIDDTDRNEEGDDGAMMETQEDAAEQDLAESQEAESPPMNPMAMSMGYAMGMMDSTSTMSGRGMHSAMGGMENMRAMSMSTENMLEDGETTMEMLEDSIEDDYFDEMDDNQNNNDPNRIDDPDTNINAASPQIKEPQHISNSSIEGVGLDQESIAPDDFFASGENSVWNYNFEKEFKGEQIDGYRLSNATISTLNTLEINGVLDNWNFDSTVHGELALNFSNDFSATLDPGNKITIDIEILAFNEGGTSGFINYEFTIYNEDIVSSTNTQNINGGGDIINDAPGQDTTFLPGVAAAASDNTVFLGDGNDRVDYSSSSQIVKDNTFYLGEGNNKVFTGTGTGDNTGNVFIGGDQQDEFTLDEVRGRFHGMDGHDTFIININDPDASNADDGSAHDALIGSTNGILIDGGDDDGFRAYEFLNGLDLTPSPQGISDRLSLTGNGSLDFTQINDDFIKGIERITLFVGNQNITLSDTDVLQMTDERNTLSIASNNTDTINLIGFTKIQDDIQFDENGNGTVNNFDVYQGDNGVTVLVQDQGSTIIA